MKIIFGSISGKFEQEIDFQKVCEKIQKRFQQKSFKNGVCVCKTSAGKISFGEREKKSFIFSQISNLEKLCKICIDIFEQPFHLQLKSCVLKDKLVSKKSLLRLGDDIGGIFERTCCLFGNEKSIKFLIRNVRQVNTLLFDGSVLSFVDKSLEESCVSELIISPTLAISIKSFSVAMCFCLFEELKKYL